MGGAGAGGRGEGGGRDGAAMAAQVGAEFEPEGGVFDVVNHLVVESPQCFLPYGRRSFGMAADSIEVLLIAGDEEIDIAVFVAVEGDVEVVVGQELIEIAHRF